METPETPKKKVNYLSVLLIAFTSIAILYFGGAYLYRVFNPTNTFPTDTISTQTVVIDSLRTVEDSLKTDSLRVDTSKVIDAVKIK